MWSSLTSGPFLLIFYHGSFSMSHKISSYRDASFLCEKKLLSSNFLSMFFFSFPDSI